MKNETKILSFSLAVFLLVSCAHRADEMHKEAATELLRGEKVSQAPVAGESGGKEGISYIKGITFHAIGKKERVSISLSGTSETEVSRESEKSIIVTLRNCFVPQDFRKRLGIGELRNLRYLHPAQKVSDQEQRVVIAVELLNMVPFRVKEEKDVVIVDFDVSTLAYDSSEAAPSPSKPGAVTPSPSVTSSMAENILRDAETAGGEEIKKYTGKHMSINVQNASIKSVFRIISEVSSYSIVTTSAVQDQRVSLHMTDVPWDQVLNSVLEINGLGQKVSGSVITVLPIDDLKKAEAEQIEKDASEGKLRQVSIEAKIVEVSTNFTRQLGVKWGAGYQGTWGTKDYGIMVGNSATGTVTTLPGSVGLTNSNIAVNFPSAAAVTTPALGLIFGTSKAILDAQIAALETSGDGKIISSPKVTTLDNVKAMIDQGEEIPYAVTDSEGNRTIEFKKATLHLEVTPTITKEGKISMEVRASNDYADWTKTNTSNENPPINTSSVESKVVVNNGDTIVIGGVYKTTESDSITGVPFLSSIPVLGWLFKYKTVSIEKRELLIFVTPRIAETG